MPAGTFIRRLFGDSAAVADVSASAERARPRRAIPDPATIVAASVGQKVLHGWLQNRHQTRYPLVLNLRNHTPAQTSLIVEAVAHALQSGDAGERSATDAAAWLKSIGGDAAIADMLEAVVPQPMSLVQRLQSAGMAPQGYAASARALGRRTLANRRFLDYLSARLGIPDEVARSINRRYAS